MPKNAFLQDYLSEVISYGGVPYTRGAAIADMQSQGLDQAVIDRWLQGQELRADLMRQTAKSRSASRRNF